MNKFEEEIEKRYGSFELSHDKNKLITDDIKSFTADVASKFGQYLSENYLIGYDNGEHFYMKGNGDSLDIKELFEIFINNHYGK
jgi:hypothetical protein